MYKTATTDTAKEPTPATRTSRKTRSPCMVTVTVVVPTLRVVSDARAVIVFNPSRRVRFANHAVVPVVRSHVVPSTLTSTLSTATSSDAVPVTLTIADRRVVPFCGDVIAMVGGTVSIAARNASWPPTPVCPGNVPSV